jgi:hypothetical protein
MALISDARVKTRLWARGRASAADVALTTETPDIIAVRTLNGSRTFLFDEEGESWGTIISG